MDRIRTIRGIYITSIIVHAVYVLVNTIIIATQSLYTNNLIEIIHGDIPFVFPLRYIGTLLSFIVHLTLTLVILSMVKNEFSTRVPEVVGIVLYSGAFIFINIILSYFEYRVGNSSSHIAALANLNQILSMTVFLSNIATTLFIVACAMSWYRKTTLREYRE